VATPAITSGLPYFSTINLESSCLIKVLTNGKESEILLSQYIGDFQPEAHVKGCKGLSLTAFICNKYNATLSAICLSFTIKK
jgi:hypothetical protein